MSQTVVNSEPIQAFEGMVHDRPELVKTGIATNVVYFGKALSRSKTDLAVVPSVHGYTNGEVFEGIAMADTTKEPEGGIGAFAALDAVQMLRKGRIWVRSADAVNDLTKSVFVRNTDDVGTAATITDSTTYPVADQDGKTSIVTISGYAPQTVTFAGATTTAAGVAAQMNAQLKGCSVAVVGGKVKITTDAVGSGVTISVAAGTGALTWASPVAGTGDIAVLAENAKGSFRATTTTGYTDLGAIADVKWIAAATINAKYYGLLAINEG